MFTRQAREKESVLTQARARERERRGQQQHLKPQAARQSHQIARHQAKSISIDRSTNKITTIVYSPSLLFLGFYYNNNNEIITICKDYSITCGRTVGNSDSNNDNGGGDEYEYEIGDGDDDDYFCQR